MYIVTLSDGKNKWAPTHLTERSVKCVSFRPIALTIHLAQESNVTVGSSSISDSMRTHRNPISRSLSPPLHKTHCSGCGGGVSPGQRRQEGTGGPGHELRDGGAQATSCVGRGTQAMPRSVQRRTRARGSGRCGSATWTFGLQTVWICWRRGAAGGVDLRRGATG
jgi:hypothetical protein